MKKTTAAVLAAVIMILCFTACSGISNDTVADTTRQYCQALVDGDYDTVIALSHPDYSDELIEALQGIHAFLSGGIGELKAYNWSSAAYDSTYKGAYNEIKYHVTIGSDEFNVRVFILDNKAGYGVAGFELTPR